MRPRKRSTSSGNPTPPLPRPRYLGIEVAGVPLPSPRGVEMFLRRVPLGDGPAFPIRVVRVEHRRAIVEVPHTAVARARDAWNRSLEGLGLPWGELRSVRTWGTLLKAKAWLRTPTVSRAEARTPPASTGERT